MSSLPSATFGSPANSFYAPYDQAASNWYNYSSLTGKIYLQDSNGVQVLQAIGGDLFFNNELLAKAGDIQLIDEWALYPAVSTVYMNQQSTLGVSLLQADTLSTASLLATTATISGVAEAGTLATVAGPYVPGDVKTATVTASGAVSAGSVSATGAVSGGSLATSGGLNMNNTAISAVSAVNISAFGMGPYGQLTSPDGSNLTWNGGTIITGGGGAASNWSVYPATQAVNINNKGLTNVSTLTGVSAINGTTYAPTQNWAGYFASGDVVLDGHTLYGGTNSDLNLASQACNVNITSYYTTNVNATDVAVTADAGASPTNTPVINMTAKNGPLGGNISLNANGGYLGQAGFGKISLNAYGTSGALPLGGLIELNAYSGLNPSLLGLTSAIRQTAASIGLSAGALPSIPALAGGLVLYGNDLVSLTAGLPGVLPQIPGTLYEYGVTGVTVESPGYIDLRSPGTYTQHIYPSDSGSNLIISGRTLPSAGVELQDVVKINMVIGNGGQITACSSINSMNFEDNSIANVSTLQVSTINGVAFPQPSADVYLWADFPASSTIDAAGRGIVGISTLMDVSTINGAVYPPPIGDSALWATFPAVTTVDLSGFGLSSVATMYVQDNFVLVSASSIGIFSDNAGDLSIASNGGGAVNIGTGNQGDINLNATANDLTLAAERIGITAVTGMTLTDPTGIIIDAPSVDLTNGNLINVTDIDGVTGTNLTLNSSAGIGLISETDSSMIVQAGSATITGFTDANIEANTGVVNLQSVVSVNVPSCVLSMNNNKITNLSTGVALTDAVNLGQLTTATNFRDTTEFYVSNDGLDTNPGSILAPLKTIQAAITKAELISSAALICVINVASGHYTESLTFNKGYVVLSGSLQTQTGNEVCEITGSITINCTGANDVFNRQVAFQGFNLTMIGGQTIVNTSSASHTVAFQDCKVFVDNVFYTSSASAPDMRTYFTNMEITSVSALNTATVISTNVGLVEFERVDLTVNGNAIGIAVGGTSVLNRCSLSTLDNTNTAAILKPLINITSSTTSTHSLGNVAFAFTSSVAKTNTNALAIASSINTAIIMLNCVFTLAGTANSTNFCVGYNGVGSPTIAGVNNTSLSVNLLLPQTVTVQSGIAQVSYIDINPPGLATYSSSVDQVIALTAVPQALTYNTTQFNQGTTLLANSRVYANAQGNYVLNYSVELQHTGAGPTQIATTFLKKNGTTIANTGRQWSITSANFQIAAMAEFVVALNAGDYVEVFFSGDTSLSANATAATAALPAIPSVVFNIKQFR
jgi:hypothetical protein